MFKSLLSTLLLWWKILFTNFLWSEWEMLKSEVAPANKSLCQESQSITTMFFGDELPQSIRNIWQVKRMAAKSIGHDRRKVSSSSSAYTNFKNPRTNTSGSRRFGNHGRCNLKFKRHFEYRKPSYQRSHVILERAPVKRRNYNEFASYNRLSSGRWPFCVILLVLE